jgi:hypothetical protein
MGDNFERLVRWYMRFNGYFTIENFYIHNPQVSSRDLIGSRTEAHIIGVRMPYPEEISGSLRMAFHEPLVTGASGRRYDVVVAEVKKSEEASLTAFGGTRTILNHSRQ